MVQEHSGTLQYIVPVKINISSQAPLYLTHPKFRFRINFPAICVATEKLINNVEFWTFP